MKRFYLYLTAIVFIVTAEAKRNQNPLAYGNPRAPVQVLELISPSCHVCAEFRDTLLPQIKKHYVDTGKVYLDVRLMAYNYLDLRAATFILAHRAPKKACDIIFKTQPSWIMAKDPVAGLNNILKKYKLLSNLSKTKIESYETQLIKESQVLDKKHTVDAIPMFIIGRRKIIGLLPWKDLKKHIDEALRHVKSGQSLNTFGPPHDHKKKSQTKNRRPRS